MTKYEIIMQGVGVLGIIASIISFQCKRHKPLMVFRTLNEFLFAIQYCMLGAYTGMAMNIIGCTRNLIFAKQVEKGKNTVPARIAFSVAFILFCIATWAGAKSILIGVAKVISTFAYGSKSTGVVRLLVLFTSVAWLIYNFMVGSYAGFACEAFSICSIVTGIIRIDILKYDKKTPKAQ